MKMRSILLLLLSLIVVSHATKHSIPLSPSSPSSSLSLSRPTSTLWGVVMNSNEEGVEIDTVTIDESTGALKTQLEVFRYLSGAAMYDGCSVLDQKNQVLYFAADFQSSFIFAVDLKQNSLLPPISIPGDTYVAHLAWDSEKGRLFALAGFGEEVAYVFMFGTNGNLPTEVIANLSSPGYRYFEFAAYDWTNSIYYFSYYLNYTQYVGYFNIDSFAERKSFQITCPYNNATLKYLYYDNDSKSLVSVVGISQNEFYFLTMDATGGNCVAEPLSMGTAPIILAVTYDTSKQILYMSVAYNGGNSYLYTYQVTSKQLANVVVDNAISDIQIDVTGM